MIPKKLYLVSNLRTQCRLTTLLPIIICALLSINAESFSVPYFLQRRSPNNNIPHTVPVTKWHFISRTAIRSIRNSSPDNENNCKNQAEENVQNVSSAASRKQSGNRLLIFGLGNVGKLVAKRGAFLVLDNDTRDDNGDNDGFCNEFPFFDQIYGTVRSKNTTNYQEVYYENIFNYSDATQINNKTEKMNANVNSVKDIQLIEFSSHQQLRTILPTCTHILITIPPIDPNLNTNKTFNTTTRDEHEIEEVTLVGGRPRQWKYFCDPVLNHPHLCLEELLPPNTWVGYVSSTSVYGNHDGEWVNETSQIKCQPGSKGELYHRAEEEWRNAGETSGWKVNVFRCAGLYGDGRSAMHTLRKKMINGGGIATNDQTRIDNDVEAKSKKDYPTSRIHEEDVSRAILCSMMACSRNIDDTGASFCDTWNLADDDPAPRGDVMAFASKLLEETKFDPIKLAGFVNDNGLTSTSKKSRQSERERRRKTDRKRVGNQRMKEFLLPDGKLLYPSYREGLQAVLEYNQRSGVWV